MKKITLVLLLISLSCRERIDSTTSSNTLELETIDSTKVNSYSTYYTRTIIDSNITLNSSLVIDFESGYPILKDKNNDSILLDVAPIQGNMKFTVQSDTSCNFVVYTSLPDDEGNFKEFAIISLTAFFDNHKYYFVRNKEKENIPIYNYKSVMQIITRYYSMPKKDSIAKGNYKFEPRESLNDFVVFQGRLIVCAMNGNKQCLEIFKKMYDELPDEYFLGAWSESYSEFSEIYDLYIKKY